MKVVIIDIKEDPKCDVLPLFNFYYGELVIKKSNMYGRINLAGNDLSWIDPRFIELSKDIGSNPRIENRPGYLHTSGIIPFINRIYTKEIISQIFGKNKPELYHWIGIFTSYDKFFKVFREFMRIWVSENTYPTGKYVLYHPNFIVG